MLQQKSAYKSHKNQLYLALNTVLKNKTKVKLISHINLIERKFNVSG